jgi:hypothetical protein
VSIVTWLVLHVARNLLDRVLTAVLGPEEEMATLRCEPRSPMPQADGR